MGAIRVIEQHWPIVIHRSEGDPTPEQVDAYVRVATELLLRGERHVVVIDATALARVSAYSRISKKEWMRRYEADLRRHCAGIALVLSSPWLRFVSATMMLISPFSIPYRVFQTVEEGMEWGRQCLEEETG